MKKFITAILAMLYITSSTGATVYMHYCMGQISDWGIGQNDSKTCGTCGMEKTESSDNGCCKDEHKFLKDDSAQKLTESNLQLLQLFSVAIPATYTELPTVDFPSVTEENPTSHAPPRTHGVAIYIFKRSFLI
ncbi:MAG: hypothetical protein ABIP79_03545 [Chitinophagaceae bacterium]